MHEDVCMCHVPCAMYVVVLTKKHISMFNTFVDPNITVTVTGTEGVFEVGESTSLSCDVSGTDNLVGPTLTYMWQRNGEILMSQEDSSLMLTDLTTSDSGSYTCVVTVSDNLLITPITSTSTPVTITVAGM